MPNMTGRPGHRTMGMNGGSSAPHLARTPCVPLLSTLFNRGGNRRAFRLLGAGGGIISIVRWNLRPVIFGVDKSQQKKKSAKERRFCTSVNSTGDFSPKSPFFPISKLYVRHQKVCWRKSSPGEVGELRGSLGNFRRASGLVSQSTLREVLGKSLENFRGIGGEI